MAFGKPRSAPRQPRAPGEKTAPQRPAKHYALWLLGQREWSAKEMGQRLKFKGYPSVEIEECLAFLADKGLQDDARYAEVRARSKARLLGNRRIKMDLATKGIDEDTAAQAMSDLPGEPERAWTVAARFEAKLETPAQQAKAWRFLLARGFRSDTIKATLKQMQAGLPPCDDE